MIGAPAFGPQWAIARWRQPGWLLLPLRGFLAVTFTFAALQKFANPDYLNPASPTSVAAQMTSLRHSSPIGPLLDLSLHAPTLVGVLIALAELAVGLAVLVGLWTRLAAVGGMLLSLTFFFTVSWNTTPYYYGSDIVFFFAWTVIVAFGDGGVFSLGAAVGRRVRRQAGLSPGPVSVPMSPAAIRHLCGQARACGMVSDGSCHRFTDCPIKTDAGVADPPDLERRTIVAGAGVVGVVAVFAAATAGVTAAVGRLIGGTSPAGSTRALNVPGKQSHGSASTPASSPAAGQRASHHRDRHSNQPSGVVLGSTSQVPVGQAARFTDPGSGRPAYVVHPSGNTFVAFSAVCTHAGCTVGFDPSAMEFVCPCHGGIYDARTGQVLGGPPPSPLGKIPIDVRNGKILVT